MTSAIQLHPECQVHPLFKSLEPTIREIPGEAK
jgi:hypothetical protein